MQHQFNNTKHNSDVILQHLPKTLTNQGYLTEL